MNENFISSTYDKFSRQLNNLKKINSNYIVKIKMLDL